MSFNFSIPSFSIPSGLPTYSAAAVMDSLHNMKRYSLLHQGATEPNVLPSTANSTAWSDYGQGVGSLAIVFFLLAIINLLLFGCLHIMACSCWRKTYYQPHSSFFSNIVSARVWYLIFAVVILCGTSAALAQVAQLQSGFNNAVSAIDGFDAQLTAAATALSAGFVPALQGVVANLTALNADTGGSEPSIQDVITAVQAGISTAATTASSLSSASVGTSTTLHGQSVTVNQVSDLIYKVGSAVLAVFFGSVFFSIVPLWKNACCAKVFRCYACPYIFMVTAICVFTGFFLAFSLVAADACVNPLQTMNSGFSIANVNGDIITTVNYYGSCGTNTSTPPAGAFANVVQGYNLLYTSYANYTTMNATIYAMNNATLDALSDAVGAGLAAANGSYFAFASSVSCPPMYTLFTSFTTAVCGTAGQAVVTIWALATLASCLLLLTMTCSVRLCRSHPGDPRPPAAQSSLTGVGPGGNYYGQPGQYDNGPYKV